MKHQYIIDEKGKRIAVVIPIAEYDKIVEKLEMLADIKAYDRVTLASEPFIPIERAFREIDRKRKKKK